MWIVEKAMSNNQFAPDGIGDRVWHYGVLPILRLFASEDVEFYGRLRVLINTAALVAICFLFLAPVFNPAKFVNAAGITFDIAGALRLFLFERISAELEPFKDEKKYPHG